MALEDIAKLEAVGRVTLEKGSKKGRHVVSVAVPKKEAPSAIADVSTYLAKQKGIEVNSLNYDKSNGSVVIHYSDVKKGKSKARGSPGCGSSMISAYNPRQ